MKKQSLMMLSALFALCTTTALKYSYGNNFASIIDTTDTSSFSFSLIFIAAIIFFFKAMHKKQEKSWDVLLLSLILTFCITVGNTLRYNKDFSVFLYSTEQKIVTLVSIIGWFTLFFFALNSLIRLIKQNTITAESGLSKLSCRHLFGMSAFCMSIAWLPYLIAAFPGSISYDGGTQLAQAAGYLEMTNHHPILVTYILKFFLCIGRAISSESAGLFLFVLFQSALLIFALSCSIVEMKRMHATHGLLLFTLLFFCLFSLWPMYAQWVVKDTIHAAVTLLFVLCTLRAGRKEYKHWLSFYAYWLLWAILTTLTRNDGLYIVVLTLLVLILTQKDMRCKVTALLLVFLCINMSWNTFVIDANGITKSSKKEMLSIPFQQTANFVRCYGHEISAEDRNIIDQVLDYDTLPQRYNPSLSDAVKESYKLTDAENETQVLQAYFKVWLKEFRQHPMIYVKTTLANTYDYYYVENQHVVMTSHVHIGHESIMNQYGDRFDLNQPDSLQSTRAFFNLIYDWQLSAPITGIFDTTGFYTWIYLTLATLMIHFKKKGALVYLTPVFTVFLICIASPVNGTTRYMLPAMVTMPTMVAFTLEQIMLPKNTSTM